MTESQHNMQNDTQTNRTASTQQKRPDISIIVPVYNVEDWLERACDSLKAQTFTNFEVWLVDDGSKDNSGAICDKIAASDPRFNALHQKNAGAAAARNTAFPHATGKYFYFMDPDDWCEPIMLEVLYSTAEKNNSQLVITGYYIDTYYSDEKFFEEKRNASNRNYETQSNFRRNAHKLFDAQLLYAPWNKLYRASHLKRHEIKYPDTFWDDLPFNVEVIRQIDRVSTVDGHFYHFLRARAEAENTKYRPNMYEKREEEDALLRELYKEWGLNNPEITEFLARRYSERLIGCVENLTCKSCTLTHKQVRAEIKRITCNDKARSSYKQTKPNSFMMRCMLVPYRLGNVTLIILESKFISFVKRHSTNLFARLKASR